MMFFVWLAGGGGVFSRIETDHGQDDWTFANALYFCDVTILTVGFGDLVPSNDISRGLVFPYSVGGIIMLGLVVSSIYKFSTDLGQEKVVRKHINKIRSRTLNRTVSSSFELRQRVSEKRLKHSPKTRPPRISAPFNAVDLSAATRIREPRAGGTGNAGQRKRKKKTMSMPKHLNPAAAVRRHGKKPRLLLLREGRDRFEAMRAIQHSTARFKRWYGLTLSVIAFGILWCVGAVVFWQAERKAQGLTYFQALYFCYVSLLTVGYGDLAPKSNAGRSFFVVWSLIAVPTMTILISDMGDTVISGFKNATSKLADVTVLPKAGIWHDFVQSHPGLHDMLEREAARRRIKRGIPLGPPSIDDNENGNSNLSLTPSPSQLETAGLARSPSPAETDESDARLAQRLARAIREVASDLKADVDRVRPKRYSYEQWVEFTRLIRFTAEGREEQEVEEEMEGLVEWDWIGENSPMMAGMSEAEFVLDRLCESLGRYLSRHGEDRAGGDGEGEDEDEDEEVDGGAEGEVQGEDEDEKVKIMEVVLVEM
ncbi:putative potassium channel protein [Neofusicoccum parvum UCRNP2]|uniref:Putative potassium channel protein n=1 Tax=Botryosphaeria parva (strain UCR-NP2) TaxID=1287680 RepID=R1GVM1_BOTPV|nr:putative potassium channel protein [Neofusicoccum parvum UCRNP2]